MYALFSRLPLRQLLAEQLPALGPAFLTASFYYRFHSFALECLSFLATWFVFDAVLAFLRRQMGVPGAGDTTAASASGRQLPLA
jgi:hypothetical protein